MIDVPTCVGFNSLHVLLQLNYQDVAVPISIHLCEGIPVALRIGRRHGRERRAAATSRAPGRLLGARNLRGRLPGLLRHGGPGHWQACQGGRRDGRANANQQRARLCLWEHPTAPLRKEDNQSQVKRAPVSKIKYEDLNEIPMKCSGLVKARVAFGLLERPEHLLLMPALTRYLNAKERT